MSEQRSRFWLWLCIVVMVAFGSRCDFVRYSEIRDLQRRVGQLESDR
jgi:hypothetical protein